MQRILFWLVYPLLLGISKLPFPIFYKVSDLVCFLVYRVLGYRKKTVRYNLDMAFPNISPEEKKRIEKKFYRHMCDMFLEMIKSISITEAEMRKRFIFKNPELLKSFEDNNESIIIMTGHYASYEWSSSMQFFMDNTGYGVYKKIKNDHFDALIRRTRERWNNELLQNKIAPKAMARHQAEGIKATYAFFADQSPKASKNNHFSLFFDHKVPFFTGTERISKNLNIPLVFMNVQKKGRGFYEASFEVMSTAPSSVPDYELTDLFAKKLEAQIKNAPEYYLWTHKRFKHVEI
ncbi:lysophospholipid acyltransferase family protein [Flavimarina sp. Hel_I_48]|uniref:lysophospholipid acyltransferase family protein n=1 Tax=Flavimarina sp. Hel_I_48 TaxID=1392488 RepID=UPI0004DFC511|nr:lipid A biosynthesis acyltransferase [Flavimarina sp. Hel_I_48]